MKSSLLTIILFTTGSLAADRLRHAMITAAPVALLPRQIISSCPAEATACADGSGCCPSGAACNHNARGQPTCDEPCGELDTSCPDGSCCNQGFACPSAGGSICEQTSTLFGGVGGGGGGGGSPSSISLDNLASVASKIHSVATAGVTATSGGSNGAGAGGYMPYSTPSTTTLAPSIPTGGAPAMRDTVGWGVAGFAGLVGVMVL